MVASVNGRTITRSEVDQATEVLLTQYKDQIPTERMEQAKSMIWKQALESLVNQSLLTQEAERADIQIDAKFNKAGWHMPQHRMRALWGDVAGLRDGTTPPEPLFFRANTGDCVQYVETNLVPKDYELDDFQVRTPTDVIGAHIHLVKFDVTASDGSANGFNYEDGALAPGEVRERIHAINEFGGLIVNDGTAAVDIGNRLVTFLLVISFPIVGPYFYEMWVGELPSTPEGIIRTTGIAIG